MDRDPGYRPAPLNGHGGSEPIDRVVIINDLSEAKGGATGLALLAARLLVQRGVPVTFICGDDASHIDPQYDGVEFVPVGGKTIMQSTRLRAFRDGIYNKSTVEKIRSWIASNDSARTVYHLHGWSKILSPSVFEALRPIYPRLIMHAHDFFLACPNGAFFNYQSKEICSLKPLSRGCLLTQCDKRNYQQKLWRSARQISVRRSRITGPAGPRMVMIHDSMRPYFSHSGFSDDRMVVIRNPFQALSASRIKAEENGDIFFIGRIEEEKGIEDLVAASRLANIKLRVIGHGPLSAKLQADYPDIDWLGWRKQAEIGELLKAARCAVLPSRYPEPFGLVALEALTSGIPVLFSSHAFLAQEAVADGYAFVADTRDHHEFAKVLGRIESMPKHEMQAMSERAFDRSPRLANTTERWTDLLQQEYAAVL